MSDDTTAVKDQTEVPPASTEESAPSKPTDESPGAQVERSDSGDVDEGEPRNGDGKLNTIVELRKSRREWRQRAEANEVRLKALEERFNSKPAPTEDRSQTTPQISTLEDLDRYLDDRFSKRETNLRQQLKIEAEQMKALEHIRAQEGFTNDDEDVLADIMEENGLDILARINPRKAAELGLKLWKEEKGLVKSNERGKAQTTSVRGASPSSGGKQWTRGMIQELADRAGRGENVDKEFDEAMKAAKEGRVQED